MKDGTPVLAALDISPATFKRDVTEQRDRLGTPIVFHRDLGDYRLDSPQEATKAWPRSNCPSVCAP